MRSRILIGAAAWLLGAVAATAGSLLAVEQLGEGILQQQSGELSVSAINARLAAERGSTGTPHASGSATPTPRSSARTKHPAGAKATRSVAPGRILGSADGTAFAECRAGGAYLVYWTPQNGFDAEHVVQGPAPVARVVFHGAASGVIMKVSCRAGRPIAHLTTFRWANDSGHDN